MKEIAMTEIEAPPGKSGFRMPAEWEPHEATWLAWPSSPETFPGELRSAKNTLARCAAALTQPHGATHAWERVRLLVRKEEEEEAHGAAPHPRQTLTLLFNPQMLDPMPPREQYH